jgi:hypothetical protein
MFMFFLNTLQNKKKVISKKKARMEVLSLQFTFKNEPVMSVDNPAQRLEMVVPLTGVSSISLVQGIDLARVMWKSFNPDGDDIAPYITSASESERYRIKRSPLGIRAHASEKTKQGVFSLEAQIPSMDFLKGVQSGNNVVKVVPPVGLFKDPPAFLPAKINTSKVLVPKKSPLAKLIEFALKTVAAPKLQEKPADEAVPVVLPSIQTAANPAVESERSSRQKSSEGNAAPV